MSQTFEELQQQSDNRNLVRRVMRAVAFIAPKSTAMVETLTDAEGAVVELPDDWLPVGIVDPSGYVYGSDVEKDEIDALGYASPVRTDITAVTRSVTFVSLEYGRKHMLELALGTDLSGVTQAAGGEIAFDEPDMPIGAEYRLLIIGSDGPVANNWLLGRGYPNVKLAEAGEQSWSKEGAVEQEFTLDVFTDADLGYPVRHFIAGTGAAEAAAALGFGA